ncbi:N-formylglutamate amidohydrolase [bacterium]|nr:N-formylglutamate amidohydrolase [bacterium]
MAKKGASKNTLLFTCEHGGNQVPREHARRFVGLGPLLKTHRGWDPGALTTARYFANQFQAELQYSEVTRLLVELNRSESNPAIFSKLVPPASQEERQAILETHYRPYRRKVLDWIADQVRRKNFVWHLSFHSFTPELNGQVRNAEFGLLYDPSRQREREFCQAWRTKLRKRFPGYRVRMNYPYRGTTDGHTTALRKQFKATQYAGIEIEVNQKLYRQSPGEVKRLIADLGDSFAAVWEQIATF